MAPSILLDPVQFANSVDMEYHIFGLNVAAQFSQLPRWEAVKLQASITKSIYETRLRVMEEQSKVAEVPPLTTLLPDEVERLLQSIPDEVLEVAEIEVLRSFQSVPEEEVAEIEGHHRGPQSPAGTSEPGLRFNPPLTPPSTSNPHTPASPSTSMNEPNTHTCFGNSPATSFSLASPTNMNPSPMPHPSAGSGFVAKSPQLASPGGLLSNSSPGPVSTNIPGHSPVSSFMQTGHHRGPQSPAGTSEPGLRFDPPLTPPSISNPHTPASPSTSMNQPDIHTSFGNSPTTSFGLASPTNINPSPMSHSSPGSGFVANFPQLASPGGLLSNSTPGPVSTNLPGHSPVSSFRQTDRTAEGIGKVRRRCHVIMTREDKENVDILEKTVVPPPRPRSSQVVSGNDFKKEFARSQNCLSEPFGDLRGSEIFRTTPTTNISSGARKKMEYICDEQLHVPSHMADWRVLT